MFSTKRVSISSLNPGLKTKSLFVLLLHPSGSVGRAKSALCDVTKSRSRPSRTASRRRRYLLHQTHHAGVLAHGQAQRHGQGLLVLQAAGVELGPELHLQLPVLLLGKLELRHAALQLQGGRRRGGQREREGLESSDLPPRRRREGGASDLGLHGDGHFLLQAVPGQVGDPLRASAVDLRTRDRASASAAASSSFPHPIRTQVCLAHLQGFNDGGGREAQRGEQDLQVGLLSKSKPSKNSFKISLSHSDVTILDVLPLGQIFLNFKKTLFSADLAN